MLYFDIHLLLFAFLLLLFVLVLSTSCAPLSYSHICFHLNRLEMFALQYFQQRSKKMEPKSNRAEAKERKRVKAEKLEPVEWCVFCSSYCCCCCWWCWWWMFSVIQCNISIKCSSLSHYVASNNQIKFIMGSDTIEWTENRCIICHAVAGCLISKVTIKLAEFNTLLYQCVRLLIFFCRRINCFPIVKATQIHHIFHWALSTFLLIHSDMHSIM